MKGHEDSNPDVAFEALVRAQLTRMGYDASAVPDEVAGAQTFMPSSSPHIQHCLPSLRCYAPSCASTTLRRTRLRL